MPKGKRLNSNSSQLKMNGSFVIESPKKPKYMSNVPEGHKSYYNRGYSTGASSLSYHQRNTSDDALYEFSHPQQRQDNRRNFGEEGNGSTFKSSYPINSQLAMFSSEKQ